MTCHRCILVTTRSPSEAIHFHNTQCDQKAINLSPNQYQSKSYKKILFLRENGLSSILPPSQSIRINRNGPYVARVQETPSLNLPLHWLGQTRCLSDRLSQWSIGPSADQRQRIPFLVHSSRNSSWLFNPGLRLTAGANGSLRIYCYFYSWRKAFLDLSSYYRTLLNSFSFICIFEFNTHLNKSFII